MFPADSFWHADVRRLPVHKRRAQWLSHMDATGRNLHPDFGPSYGDRPVPYGIPVTYVDRLAPEGPGHVRLRDESDHVPYPFGADTQIEGGADSGGDLHAIVVDTEHLHALRDLGHPPASARLERGLRRDLGPALATRCARSGWTSADAAGLPILPGLLRWDEVARAAHVDHAIRFTTDVTSTALRVAGPARRRLAARASTTRRWAPGSG